METNESILTRNVVGLEDRKVLGKVSELRVDCDTLAVDYYVVGSSTTNAPLACPFDAAISVGDTFLTVPSREVFLPSATAASQDVIANGFKLLGVEAFTRTGNKLAPVSSYEFDPVYGTITSVTLEDGTVFPAEAFVFFAPEFIFVDDGAKSAAEMRNAGERPVYTAPAPAPATTAEVIEEKNADLIEREAADAASVFAPSNEAAAEALDSAAEFGAEVAEAESVIETADRDAADASVESLFDAAAATAVAADEPEETVGEMMMEAEAAEVPEAYAPAVELSEEDAALIDFLTGATVSDDVVSEDGQFSVAKGTVLTEEMVRNAHAHGALLMLTMSVDV